MPPGSATLFLSEAIAATRQRSAYRKLFSSSRRRMTAVHAPRQKRNALRYAGAGEFQHRRYPVVVRAVYGLWLIGNVVHDFYAKGVLRFVKRHFPRLPITIDHHLNPPAADAQLTEVVQCSTRVPESREVQPQHEQNHVRQAEHLHLL